MLLSITVPIECCGGYMYSSLWSWPPNAVICTRFLGHPHLEIFYIKALTNGIPAVLMLSQRIIMSHFFLGGSPNTRFRSAPGTILSALQDYVLCRLFSSRLDFHSFFPLLFHSLFELSIIHSIKNTFKHSNIHFSKFTFFTNTGDSTTMSENLLNKYFINEIFAYTVECKAHSSKNSDENNNNSSLHWKVINSYQASKRPFITWNLNFLISIWWTFLISWKIIENLTSR